MTPPRNVVVAQSGGPSPVINNSLRGVVETCRVMPDHFGVVYAGHHGIEGILRPSAPAATNCDTRRTWSA
jgi:6-phosphofructokinase 1